MCILKEKQIKTLELFRQGKNLKKIAELTHYSRVDDAIERGIKNVDNAIEILRIAIERNLMTQEQRTRARALMRKL